MKIKAIAPWFGGKRTLAPKIVELIGKHTQYFEPFCGSMAVLFAKKQSQKETVNDLHGDLMNLAHVLQSEWDAVRLYERCTKTLMSEGLLQEAKSYFQTEPDWIENDPELGNCERAYWYFVASWMGRNGTAGTARLDYQIAVRWTKNGGSPTVRFKNAVESMPKWHKRLQNVVLMNRDAFRIIDRFEDVEQTAIYVDSPYVSETRAKGAVKNGKGGKYLHEFNHESTLLEQDDHTRLADVLNNYQKARIVVSHYDCQHVRNLYSDWAFHDHTMNKQLHAQNGRGARIKKAPEVLITNF